MLEVGKPQFWGSREPECLRHIVHWQMPFCGVVSTGGLVGVVGRGGLSYALGRPIAGVWEHDGEAYGAAETATCDAVGSRCVSHDLYFRELLASF